MCQTDLPRPGQLVCSKAGHDKGRIYLVLRQEAERVFLTDGKHRPLDRAKPKNIRHLKIIEANIAKDLLEKIAHPGDPGSKNAHIRAALALYEKE